ncbi:MAG: TonB-dependent receptor, partial [Pedobacter sp.]|nr:TonB-dependent receptor [Pedobacter sp.]
LKQQYSLNLQGGTSVMGWNLSVGYDKNSDNLDANYDRLNLRFQNTIKPLKNLEIASGLTITQSKSVSGKLGYGEISSKGSAIYPYAVFADEAGNALPIVKDWRYNYIETAGDGKLLDWKYYPLEDYKHQKSTSKLGDLIANIGLNYRLPAGLSIDIKYQYERQSGNNEFFQGQDSYYVRNLINGYTQISPLDEVNYKVPKGAVVNYSDNLMQSNNIRGQLNFNLNRGKHTVTAIAGSEFRQANPVGHTSRVYGYDVNTLTSGLVDYTLQYPNYITGTRSYISNGISVIDRLTRFASLYANGAYTYFDRYSLSISARRDASNLFGFKTNDRWNPLWSTGVSWELSKEDFYGNTILANWLPYIRMRATYGFSGNIHPTMASATTIQYYGNSPYTMSPYARFNNYANPDLKWETTGMLNLGLDFKSANNRISGSIEYYQKKSKDLFATFPIDYTGGVGTTITKNAANMKGSGFDITLQSLNLNSKFKWNSDINFSTNHDEITNFYLSSERGSNFMATIPTLTGVIGKPVYSIMAYKWAGLDPQTGAPRGYLNGEVSNVYVNLTGTQTTLNDLKYYGSAIPTLFGSVGNTFSWKGLSASIRIMYKLGHYFRKSTISYSGLYSNWVGHSDYARRWQKPGDELVTDIPSLMYPASSQAENFYIFSEPFILKADHIRLQYINLSYQLDKKDLQQLPFKSAQFFINLSNLGILWRANKEGIDPDYDSGSTALPPTKTYSLG